MACVASELCDTSSMICSVSTSLATLIIPPLPPPNNRVFRCHEVEREEKGKGNEHEPALFVDTSLQESSASKMA